MNTFQLTLIITSIYILSFKPVIANDEEPSDNIKQLSGISIVGDKEAPKSLYIVPWHNTDLDQDNKASSGYMVDNMRSLDRSSLLREIELHRYGRRSYNKKSKP